MTHSSAIKDLFVPVYIPDNNGEPVMVIGDASIKANTLVVEFGTSIAAEAVKRLFEKGDLMGFVTIQLENPAVAEPTA